MLSRRSALIRSSLAGGFLATMAFGGEPKAKDVEPTNSAPQQMEPITVSSVFTSIKIRPYYRDTPSGPRVAKVLIEDVRKGSKAERAGLSADLEILAIQGVAVAGLSDLELENLSRAPVVEDELVFKVVPARRRSTVRPQEIRIPVPKVSAEKPHQLSITVAPKGSAPRADK